MKRTDFYWILPAGLALGFLLAFVSPGVWWAGLPGFALLSIVGFVVLTTAWRRVGGGRTLAWVLALAFVLRLGMGLTTYLVLPYAGYGNQTEKAGYLFFDAFRRDTQAWDLAHSSQPLSEAFDSKMYSDQYGGLLFTSAAVYRFLSPDAQRPLLMLLLAAWMGALGAAFVWAAGRRTLGEQAGRLSAWIFALYPEAILQGSSQMREPFLMTFIALAFYGVIEWQAARSRTSWLWIGLALAGMLFFSPGFALLTLVAVAGWIYFSGETRRIPWQVLAAAAGVFVLALAALTLSWNSLVAANSGPLGVLGGWARETAKFNAYTLQRSSGIVQLLFESFPSALQLPFVTLYGVLQPVLPAALFEPAASFWQTLGIVRALGWYLFLPFLAYAPFSAWNRLEGQRRKPWVWLAALVWVWVLVASLRGGGDQWDNPRYRVILLVWQALLVAQAWGALRQKWSRWFGRILAVEAILVLVFGHWYLYRYVHVGLNLGVRNSLLLAIGLSLLVVLGDWFWARRTRA